MSELPEGVNLFEFKGEKRAYLVALLRDTQIENVRLGYLLESVDMRKRAEAVEALDCRLCTNHSTTHGCITGTRCVQASGFNRVPAKQLWK